MKTNHRLDASAAHKPPTLVPHRLSQERALAALIVLLTCEMVHPFSIMEDLP